MSLLNLPFLFIIIFIGVITSYTDIKYGKIRNKEILGGLLLGIFSYLIIIVFLGTNLTYLRGVALNTLFAFLVGYGMWLFKLWTPGDAKLFTVYAFLIPQVYYSNWYLKYFPSFTILINTFLPLLGFFVAKACFYLLVKKGERVKFWEKIRTMGKKQLIVISKIFPFILLIVMLLMSFKPPFNHIFLFLPLLVIMKPLGKILSKRNYLNLGLVILITTLLLIIRRNDLGSLYQLLKINFIRVGIFVAIFITLNTIITYRLSREKTKTTFLALWMFLGVILTLILRQPISHFFFKFLHH